MICKGSLERADINDEIAIVNTDGLEIYRGYKHKSAQGKIVIHGCDNKYNYIGEAVQIDGREKFIISENDVTLLEIEKLPSLLIPKCKINYSKRDLTVRFRAKGGQAKMIILDDGEDIASMAIKKQDYEIVIKNGENPTLLTAILVGIGEANKLADRPLAKV